NLASTLADGNVDALHVQALLVDDGVDGDGGFTRLPVTDNQLTLTAANRDHRVDGEDTGLHRAVHVPPIHHARGQPFNIVVFGKIDRAFAVDRVTQRIDHAANHPRPY